MAIQVTTKAFDPPIGPVGPVAPVLPRGIVKLKTAAPLVPLFVMITELPAAPVATVPSAIVAAAPSAARGRLNANVVTASNVVAATLAGLPGESNVTVASNVQGVGAGGGSQLSGNGPTPIS